jgi:hypothetical protein
MRLLENNQRLLVARRWTFRILLISLFVTLFAVAINHAARFTRSMSLLFLLYCAAALLLSIFHVSREVLVAIVQRPTPSTSNTHRSIVLIPAILACGWTVTASFWTHCQTTNAGQGVCPRELGSGPASVGPKNWAMITLGWWNMILYILYGCIVGYQAYEVVLPTDRSSKQAQTEEAAVKVKRTIGKDPALRDKL